MTFVAIQLLVLIVCAHQSTSEEIQEVKPRWISNNRNSNRRSLPDFIELDLELESGKITLNLWQSTESIKPPVMIIESEGQNSIWEQPDDDIFGVYKDTSLDATATVTIRNVDRIEETLYMITFTHDGRSISLGPNMIFLDSFSLVNKDNDSTEAVFKNGNENNNNGSKSKILKIDGVLHSLHEVKSTTSKQNSPQGEDYLSGMMNESRIMKREAKKMKRLITIEIFTFTDHTFVEMFSELSKATSKKDKMKDALMSTRYLFTHLMEGVKNIYERIDMEGLKFTTTWVGGYFALNSSHAPFFQKSLFENGTINKRIVFRNLNEWLHDYKHRFNWPKHDLFAAFTRRSISYEDRSFLGLTAQGEICSSFSLAIVRYSRFYETMKTMAHELGHSLGLVHDGEDDNDCNVDDRFVMSPTFYDHFLDDFHNSFLFSKCSLKSLKFIIENTTNVGNATSPQTTKIKNKCLLNGGKDFNSDSERAIILNLHPGQVFDPDAQCEMEFGPKSQHIGGNEAGQDFCQELKCTRSTYILRTLDGTTCANEAWCRIGNCVHDSRAPRAPEQCIYGDKIEQHLNRTCKDEINEEPNRCEEESFRNRCCASCAGKRKMNRGCQDTINECSRLMPRDCYSKYYATTCCKTCRTLIQNPWDANCLYGDQGSGCSDLVPEVCHLPTRHCCQTCAAHVTTTRTDRDSCIHGDFNGTLDYFTLWNKDLSLTCKELIKSNSHLCHYDVVRKYCCSSCKDVKIVKGHCKDDDDKEELIYLHKKFNCRQLLDYNPRLCEISEKVKNKCCKSCGRFIITTKN